MQERIGKLQDRIAQQEKDLGAQVMDFFTANY